MSIQSIRSMFNDDWFGCGEDFKIDYSKTEDNQWWLAKYSGDFVFTATEFNGSGFPDSFENGLLINLNSVDFEHPENGSQIATSWEWNPQVDSAESLKGVFESIELCVYHLEGGK